MNTPPATAKSEMAISAITINPGSTEPLGAISSSGGEVVASSSSGAATYSSDTSSVVSSPPEVTTTSDHTSKHTDQGEITKETTVVTTVEKVVETTVPDQPTPEPSIPATELVTKETLQAFLEKAGNVGISELANKLLSHFYLIPIPPKLFPGKLPGVFALIAEVLTDGIKGDPCENALRDHLEYMKAAFQENGLNVNTRSELEALGIDYKALLRDLPQGYEPPQSS